jgi:hypothetical protein
LPGCARVPAVQARDPARGRRVSAPPAGISLRAAAPRVERTPTRYSSGMGSSPVVLPLCIRRLRPRSRPRSERAQRRDDRSAARSFTTYITRSSPEYSWMCSAARCGPMPKSGCASAPRSETRQRRIGAAAVVLLQRSRATRPEAIALTSLPFLGGSSRSHESARGGNSGRLSQERWRRRRRCRRRVVRPWPESDPLLGARAGKGHAVASERDPSEPSDVYTEFIRELAANPDCSVLVNRLREGHLADPRGWCTHASHAHRWEPHPCQILRLVALVESIASQD